RDLAAEQGVRVKAEMVVGGEFVAAGIEDGDSGLKPARHGVSQIGNQRARGDGGDDLLSLPGMKAKTVHGTGADLAVEKGRQADRQWRAGGIRPGRLADPFEESVELGIRRLQCRLGNFRQLADAELERVGQAIGAGEPDFAVTGRRIRGHADSQDDCIGERRGGIAIRRVPEQPRADVLKQFFIGGRPGVRGTPIGKKRAPPVLQGAPLVTKVAELLLVHGTIELDEGGLHALAGDKRIGGVVEKLPADHHLKRRTLASSGRINVTDMRAGRLCLRGEQRKQAERQQKPRRTDDQAGGYGAENAGLPVHMISFSRPPVLTSSAAVGATRTSSPCGCGRRALASMPSNWYMLASRSTGSTGRSLTSSPWASELPTTWPL